VREPVERKEKIYEAVNKASSLIGIEDLEKAKMEIYERVKNYSDLFEERSLEVIGEELKKINMGDIWDYIRELTSCYKSPSPKIEVGDEFWVDLFLGGSTTHLRTTLDGRTILGGEIFITPFGYYSNKKHISTYPILDILGYEGGDYFFAASISEKLGIMPTFLDQDAFRYSLYLRRAVQYAIEEKVIDEFTDEDGTTIVKNRVQWLEDHFRKVFPKSGEEFLLSNAIYRKELRGREKREIKKFLTALLFPLTKEEIPKEYKTLLGIEIEFF